MNNTRAIKIGLAWINITYVLCYVILGSLPATRPSLLPYLLHFNVSPVENIFTLGNFVGGLILWIFLWRANNDISLFILEDFWSRNLKNDLLEKYFSKDWG